MSRDCLASRPNSAAQVISMTAPAPTCPSCRSSVQADSPRPLRLDHRELRLAPCSLSTHLKSVLLTVKLDGVGPVDNIPYNNWLHKVEKNYKKGQASSASAVYPTSFLSCQSTYQPPLHTNLPGSLHELPRV